MSIFADRILLQFLQDTFVEDLLQDKLGLSTLFSLTYKTEGIELREISLAGVQRRQFQMPAFETIRTTGTEERILPSPERIHVNRTQPRYGRLSWVEVFLEVLLLTKLHKQGSPIERIATKDLIAELGGVDSLTELRNKLAERYSESVVEAFFKKLKITSVEEFKKNANLFVEFFYQEPPVFDPDDPQNLKTFRLNICVKLQSELNLTESLQTAKLCRSILENEHNFSETFKGGEIKMPYVFLTIFPESVAGDNAIPGLNATQIQQGVKALFATEGMLAHFWQPEQPEE